MNLIKTVETNVKSYKNQGDVLTKLPISHLLSALSQNIIETNWESLKNNDIDIYATNLTDKISELA